MTTSDLYALFERKVIQINNLYLTFENKRRLVVSSENEPIYTHYWFIFKNGQHYLKTEVPVINGEKEILIQIFIGGIPLFFK